MNKKTLIAIGALILVAALMVGIYAAVRPQTSQGEKAYTVTVVHGDGTSKVFSYRTNEEYLADALLAEGLLEGDITEYGLTVHTVDGETASWEANQSYWALFIGEEYATTGASETPVNDGDSFKWVYTIG